jgi:hypothetical protein
MTPSEYLIEELQDEDVDNISAIVILKKYSDGRVGYKSNDQSRTDIYGLCHIVQAFLLSDIVAQDVKREE